MTADELRHHFNTKFGLKYEWPRTFEVDAETYANCLNAIIQWHLNNGDNIDNGNQSQRIPLSIGYNKGIMFKNVELILKTN